DYYARLGREDSRAALPLAAAKAEERLGERIRRRRKVLGLTQMQAAEALGIQQGHLSKLERDKLEPSPKLRQTIEVWLNMP
ncbi:MAG: helix-turn-helix domain-containing protein, partial [Rhodospirillales bacterium]|nr:helix-turn-helix domain-containing protein [Rhodospirillales bacterium]